MNIWTPDNSRLLEYRARCETGEILVGEEMWRELENLAEDLENEDRYIYDTSAAWLRMDFMENCVRLTKSPYYNKPMKLMLWQKAFIEALYSFKMREASEFAGILIDRFKRALLLIARKNTKALALDTRVPTPDGDRVIKDIKPGDHVFDEKGKPVLVTGVSEIFHDRPCYEITFEDGEKIICDENHKWTVQTKGSRRRYGRVPKTNRKSNSKYILDSEGCITLYTHEMISDYMRRRADGKGMEYKYRVPVPAPLYYPKKELFDPYVLGLWLGDGDKNDNRLAVGYDDLDTLLEQLNRNHMPVSSVKMYGGKCEVRLGIKRDKKNNVRESLRELGVWKDKHIPEQYFTASIDQRLELLRGLMDTDGACSKNGQCSFAQKSKRMVDDVSKLLSSLGIKHTITKKMVVCNGKKCYAYWIQFFVSKSFSCFRYPRKHERLKDHLAPRMSYKTIVSVRRVENRDTKCITVDNPRGLFVCGKRNTVTHNSETTSALAEAELICGNPGSDIVASSNDDAQASIVYDAIDTMRLLIDPDSKDTKRNQRYILNRHTNTKVFKLSDRTRNKEGRNIDFGILDEAHEMKDAVIAKSIEQSQSLKDNPKFVIITTEGFIREGFLDEELGKARAVIAREDPENPAAERYLPWLYTQDSESEVWNGTRENRLWMKSNPTLGKIKKWEYMEEQVALARESKADRIFVLSKDFNLKQNGVESWLNYEDYTYPAVYDLADFSGAFCIGAVDLAETTDLCAAKVLLMRSGDPVKYVISHYFIPERKLTEDDDSAAGAQYKEWLKAGLLTTSEGNDVDLAIVADWFYRLYDLHRIRTWKCGYDQRFAKDWITRMDYYGWTKQGGDEADLIMINQNAATLSNAIKLCENDFRHQLINYNENPIDAWCLKNSGIEIKSATGDCLIVKQEPHKKIDGAVCLAILYEMYRRYRTQYKKLIKEV